MRGGKLVSYVDRNTRERMERYELERGKRKYTSLIIFANTVSYFCFVFHHTASAFSVKLF